jgi:hypothetical protein
MTADEVRVELVADGVDAEELDHLTAKLRRELRRLDVDNVTRMHEELPPPGAGGAELLALGSLIIDVGKQAGALSGVVGTVQGWVGHEPGRMARLEIDGDVVELSGAAVDHQQPAAGEWLARHREMP